MSATKNRPGTAVGTEATVFDAEQSTAVPLVKHYPSIPPMN